MPQIHSLRKILQSLELDIVGSSIYNGINALAPQRWQVGFLSSLIYSKCTHNRIAKRCLSDVTQRGHTDEKMQSDKNKNTQTRRSRRIVMHNPTEREHLVPLSDMNQWDWCTNLAVCNSITLYTLHFVTFVYYRRTIVCRYLFFINCHVVSKTMARVQTGHQMTRICHCCARLRLTSSGIAEIKVCP
ncbi:MAG: hypothetical protein GY941_17010 [Planctomycetes bacterium]|nr:hypothetical protein [Planctomycetota bacterium]